MVHRHSFPPRPSINSAKNSRRKSNYMGRAIGAMEREEGCATKDKRLTLAIIRKLLLAWEKCIAWRRKRRRNSLRERCSAEVVGWSGRRVGGEGMSLAGMGEGMRSRFQGKATRRLLTVERRRGA